MKTTVKALGKKYSHLTQLMSKYLRLADHCKNPRALKKYNRLANYYDNKLLEYEDKINRKYKEEEDSD